jgi:hypothetical protein
MEQGLALVNEMAGFAWLAELESDIVGDSFDK